MFDVNDRFLGIYCRSQVWRRRAEEYLSREDGAEAIEWIAMAAVIVLLLAAAAGITSGAGAGVGGALVGAIMNWIAKLFG